MAQPAQIGLEEGAQVGDAVFQHRQAVDAQPEGEALTAVGIEAAVFHHGGVDHAASQNLHPAAALADPQDAVFEGAADIDLHRRRREGEIAGAEAHRHIVALEEGGDEIAQAALEMAHMDGAVDRQALQLMEHRRVRHVAVAAIGASRRDDAHRWTVGEHVANLHRRGVGAQHRAPSVTRRRQIEGVVFLAGGVLVGDVEGTEIEPVVLDVGAFGDGEAHLAEDGHDLLGHLADGMDAAPRFGARRQGDVDAPGFEPAIEFVALQRLPARGKRGLERLLRPIERAAGVPAPLRLQFAQPLQKGGKAALPAQGGDADLVEPSGVGGGGDGCQRLPLNAVDPLLHPAIRT